MSDPTRLLRHVVIGFSIAISVAGCGGAGGQPGASSAASPAANGATAQAPSAAPGGAGGGAGGARGFDCATLLTPAELDQISGFTGGTVTTTTRGDQNADNPGYGECAYSEPGASTFFGSIAIASGASIEGYTAGHDFSRAHGATPISGLGTDALLVQSDAGLNIFALSTDGVGINVALAFDSTETSLDKAKAAIQKIAETVLARV